MEEIQYDKDMNVRDKVIRIMNMTLENFKSLDEYNDYLEEVEDIIFNLVEAIDVQNTEKKLKEYQVKNRKIIALNSSRREEDRQDLLRRAIEENKRIGAKGCSSLIEEEEELR